MTDKTDIKEICKKFNITNYTINPDGSIDVDNNVNLIGLNLTELPLKFRNVGGSFYCSHNNKLTSLEGCPQNIVGDFDCYGNKLTSLEGCPQNVGGDFSCSNNQLKSLEGCPQNVGGYFNCRNNQLTSLEGYPQKINGVFFCDNYLFEDMIILTKPNDQDIVTYRNEIIERYRMYVSDDYFIPIIRNEKLRKLLND